MNKVYEFQSVFNGRSKNGGRKISYPEIKQQAGVYIIKENDIVVYVGMSSSCAIKACYRHFYVWNDKRGNHYRTTYINQLETHTYTIMLMPMDKTQAGDFEKAMILALKPRDNRQTYQKVFDDLVEDEIIARLKLVDKKEDFVPIENDLVVASDEDYLPF